VSYAGGRGVCVYVYVRVGVRLRMYVKKVPWERGKRMRWRVLAISASWREEKKTCGTHLV